MKNHLLSLWKAVKTKLGHLAAFIPTIAESIQTALAEEDADKARAHVHELREAAEAIVAFCDKADEALADDKLSLMEDAMLLLELQKVADEIEDVVTGVDEDDEPSAPATE